jgi:hypothetical protein
MASTKDKKTVWFGMKLTPDQKEKIRMLAAEKGVTQKQVILDLLNKEMEQRTIHSKPGSFLDLNRDLYGSAEGLEDGSTNPDHMKEYGT